MISKRFYGLHFAEGCAEYKNKDSSYKVFISEDTMKKMDASFEGRPIFIGHVEETNDELAKNAHGHVVKSFYNKADGKCWVEFLITSEQALDLIVNKRWLLSNAYIIDRAGSGGRWHGMDYEKEILDASYDHLAIVPDPRYEESIILTPEQFKEYNEKKEHDLKMLSNSKGDKMNVLKFFKKEKVENSANLEEMSVILPKSKKEVDLRVIINEADEAALNADEAKYADEAHLVKTANGEMSVKEIVNKYNDMMKEDEDRKKNEEDKKKEEEKKNEDKKEVADDKKNDDDKDEDDKKSNEDDEEEKKKNEDEKKDSHFNSLKDAHLKVTETHKLDTSWDQVARGKARYGSK